jgi:hypothetical protein
MYSSFLSRCVLDESQLHVVAHRVAKVTSVLDDLAPDAVSVLACCLASGLSSSAPDHLILVSCAQG